MIYADSLRDNQTYILKNGAQCRNPLSGFGFALRFCYIQFGYKGRRTVISSLSFSFTVAAILPLWDSVMARAMESPRP